MKKILITGENSFIGQSVEKFLEKSTDIYDITTIGVKGADWIHMDFGIYDTVFHVAGLAHADVNHVSEEIRDLYYSVNRDLAISVATKAKRDGAKQFIFMSSMIIYSGNNEKVITKDTEPKAMNFYGDSKLQADKKIQLLNDSKFKAVILRPPMIYGKGSKGNYPKLAKMAKRMPFFPETCNKRSMLYIGNLCSFIKMMIDNNESGVFFPQNAEYTNTTELVKMIAKCSNHKIICLRSLGWIVNILKKIPGKVGNLSNKAFGDMVYDLEMSKYSKDYRLFSLEESIELTESNKKEQIENCAAKASKKILLIALPGHSNCICETMRQLGYDVVVINDKPNEGVVCKTLGRLKVPFYEKKIESYYKKKLKPYEKTGFDYIVSIRGEYTPANTLKYMKKQFCNTKLILYMWDSLKNNKNIEKKWDLYDKIYTFDRIDYLDHSDRINFLPLYYYEKFVPSDNNKNEREYDIAFIGTGHGDRVQIAKKVIEQCEKEGMKCYIYIFLPHWLIYLKNKLTNPYYKGISSKDIHYKMLPLEKAYEVYNHSKCIIDIESSSQHGLTMRTIEMIGLKKKMITTNKDIVNYDFYNSNNIMIAERDDFLIDSDFMKKPYELLEDKIYLKYSLANWIKCLLRD